MLKISCARCLGLSKAVSSQITLRMCAAAKNCKKKFTKNSNFNGLGLLKVIDVDKSKKPVTSACYDKQHVCTYLQPFLYYTINVQNLSLYTC